MTDNPMVHSASGYPVSIQGSLQPSGPTTAELRNQASPQRPNWGERTSSTNKDEVTSLGSQIPLTDRVDGRWTPPADEYVRNFANELWNNDRRSMHGSEIDRQTDQGFGLYPSNVRGRPADPVLMHRVSQNPIQIAEDVPGGDPENYRAAAQGHRRMSRRKKWMIAGAGATILVGLAIGLGVGLGIHSSSSSGSTGSGGSTGATTTTGGTTTTGATTTTTSSVAQPHASAGPLAPGAYSVSAVVKDDPCSDSLLLDCTNYTDTWEFASNGYAYSMTDYVNGTRVTDVGAADDLGTLRFVFSKEHFTLSNNCTGTNEKSVVLDLSAYSFNGTISARHTYIAECRTNISATPVVHAGASCVCTYSVLGVE